MTRKTYPSDVTNAEWQIIERLLPITQSTRRPRQVDLREIINGIFYPTFRTHNCHKDGWADKSG